MNTTTRRPLKAVTPADTGDWRDDAECRTHPDPDLWHDQAEDAKQVCNTRCTVREQCLQWALETRQDVGVWGGLTEKERRRLHGRKPRYSKPGGMPVFEYILRKKLTEFQALEAQDLSDAQRARELGTNVHTVLRVRAHLAEQGQALEVVKAA
jgi:WhiB family redox-sensing transcriptional regulator